MKILLQNKNIVLTNNSLISINSDNTVAKNGNLVRIKQDFKNNIIKINSSLVRAKSRS